ncbi:hypothetical protein K491DRAFT_378027 [Lophiostoma macrostomum CBS 122681]|uniref:Uncharacterized protein n=1 Tax=Lophiostoma macrostomum CBS 122681 TaxID=1314788 RepID=A0A6A6T9A7_9PLEO|nr:hypothetical protein K491DRAFT_378027 [Lophiostoma macrostomum CBS 122681]
MPNHQRHSRHRNLEHLKILIKQQQLRQIFTAVGTPRQHCWHHLLSCLSWMSASPHRPIFASKRRNRIPILPHSITHTIHPILPTISECQAQDRNTSQITRSFVPWLMWPFYPTLSPTSPRQFFVVEHDPKAREWIRRPSTRRWLGKAKKCPGGVMRSLRARMHICIGASCESKAGYTEVKMPVGSDRTCSGEKVDPDWQKQTTRKSSRPVRQSKREEEDEEEGFSRVTADFFTRSSMLEHAAIYAYLPLT